MSLANEAAQWASEIVPGTDEFFLCRRRTCLTVCRNTDWATTDKNGRGHDRCPNCGEQFRPWKEQPGY
eukprot:4600624-Alexandrium_andersonii.AAC.1